MPTALHLAQEAQGIFDAADAKNRPLTGEERNRVDELLERAQQHHQAEQSLKSINAAFGAGGPNVHANDPNVTWGGGGPGDLFIESQGYKNLADPSRRPQQWSTGPVDVGPQYKAGTVFEGGQGAGMIPVPQVQPGVVTKLIEQPNVAGLFASAQATTSSVRYILEGTAASGAAGVAEGGSKPASDFAWSTVDVAVKKIATSLVLSDEIFDDTPQLQGYLNSRLSLFVTAELDRQCVRGTSGGNELTGIVNVSGVNGFTRGSDDNAVTLAKVLANTAGSAFLIPDAIVMHPTNYLTTRLLRDGTGGTAGQFYGGGPFTGAYGNPGQPGLFGASLWGVPVVLSSVVGAGTAIVGCFGQAAQLYRRGGITVEATNSGYVGGKDLFTTDQIALRAEVRAALATFRPIGFCVVSGLT